VVEPADPTGQELESSMKEELISRVPLFASLPHSEIRHLANTLRPLSCPDQTLLIREGKTDDRFYILLDGQVEIIKALDSDAERLLGVRQAGSVIGEMSLFSRDGRHTASVRARTSLQLLEITRADFDALLHRQPSLAYEMVRTLSTRLDESENLTIRDLLEKNRQLRQAYDDLKAAQAQIIEKEKLESELDVARRIQRSLLPRERPRLPGFDFGMLIEPMSSVGGDFFDFIPLGGDRLGIAVGDVSDHGVPAALFMALTYSLLRAEASRAPSPAEALRNVNRHLMGLNASGMFVTVLYGILNGATREFHYVRAGHDRPLLLDAHREAIELRRGPGQLLGLLHEPTLDEQSLVLPSGGLLLMYTDGVTEAMDQDRNQFGRRGLQAALRAGGRTSAQDTCSVVRDAVSAYSGTSTPHDDITLVAVQAEGASH
jgi:serine phosphatase RsbU (regulator of sigma subunit)